MRNKDAFFVEGKESNFALKWGWLFQTGKEENLNVEKKIIEGLWKKDSWEMNFMCGQAKLV